MLTSLCPLIQPQAYIMANPTTAAQQTAGATTILPDPYQFDQDGRPTCLIFRQNPQRTYAWHHRQRTGPPKPVAQDLTIGEVIRDQDEHIADTIQAVFNLTDINDNEGKVLVCFNRGGDGSVAVPDVQAACRYLLGKVLEYYHFGFCHGGTDHAQDVDKALTCEARVAQIIKGLRDWKNICKDIMSSEDQGNFWLMLP
jgi:hypothetical protein